MLLKEISISQQNLLLLDMTVYQLDKLMLDNSWEWFNLADFEDKMVDGQVREMTVTIPK